jgi:uncharacterized protein YutE (UPF0331/DUF86 family)
MRDSVNALRELRPLTYDEFISEHVLVSAAERDLQIAIQAAPDIGSIILADQQANVPASYSDISPALAEIGIIPPEFAQSLIAMAKFRNVLVHLYLEVDPKRVYRNIQEHLDDFENFARYVSDWLQTHAAQD